MLKYAPVTDQIVVLARQLNLEWFELTNLKTYVSLRSAKNALIKDAEWYAKCNEIWKLAVYYGGDEKYKGKVKILSRIKLNKQGGKNAFSR